MNSLTKNNVRRGVKTRLGFVPDWPAPANVHSFITERTGGISRRPFDSNNLAGHVEDDPEAVSKNRDALSSHLDLPNNPHWLTQVHGVRVVDISLDHTIDQADGSYTKLPGQVCAVLTADCLPVLLCDQSGQEVAAIHCGWRGLATGIINSAVSRFHASPENIIAYLGPAIGPEVYEVGPEVIEAFSDTYLNINEYASSNTEKPGHYLLNLYALAKIQLSRSGVMGIFGGDFCTYREPHRFYSFRRDGQTGRMASLIWMS